MDEPPPLGEGAGPNPSRLLSAAIGNCLAASLLFCLRKSRLEPRGISATVTTSLARTEKGRLRVGGSRVVITLDLDAVLRERLARCTDLFEDYCVVTQSVRRGIDVAVEVHDQTGALLYDSHPAASSNA